MRRRRPFVGPRSKLFAFALLALWLIPGEAGAQSPVSAPALMWQYGGCLSGPYCDTGWYSSPAVADLDSDGQPDVIWGPYDVVALNGANGSLKWRAPSTNRIWPGIAVADLTGDGTPEVIVGRAADQLTVYDRLGGAIWTRNPFGAGEIRSLAVDDLEGDGQLEIVVGHAGGGSYQVNVLAPNGATRAGWPARHAGEPGFGTGLWNQNLAVADMNGDGLKEVFAPTGGHYITALDRSGNQLGVNGIYAPRQYWSEVGVNVDHTVDLRGWTECGVDLRPTFSDSAPVVADVNADGVPELIVVGNIYNCGTSPYTYLYHMPFIFNLDRTRWSGSGFDWTAIPAPGPGSAPRSQDWSVIETAVPNPVVADLDGDGFNEILFPSYDGKMHAYWLDKTEHHNWPYTIPTSGAPGDDFRFASEPVVVDLNNDGCAEVIFTSWPKKASGRVGQLHILDCRGVELYRIDLPAPAIGATWNGGLGAPTIANIDSDPDLELVVGTVASGVVAYKLPNTANARILWGTGRGNYGRTGVPVTTTAAPPPDTTPPTVSITSPAPGATVSGTITVSASASDDVGVAGVQFFVDGVKLGAEDVTAPFGVSWDTTTVPDGTHTLQAVARDAAGNTVTSAPVSATVANAPPDTTPPTVAITSPSSGATVSGTITVTASASDNVGVAVVELLVDGVLRGQDTTAPFAIPWDTTTVPDGTHTLVARGLDAARNTTTSAPVSVTVANAPAADTTPPTVAITSPASGATVAGTITVAASVSDNVGVAGVRFFVDGVAIGVEDTTAPFGVSWDTNTVAEGSHTLTAVARDTAGNMATSAGVTVTVDRTPPTVAITSPAHGATVSGTITVTATATDNFSVMVVELRVDGVMRGEDRTAPYEIPWDTKTVADGAHTLGVWALDAARNVSTLATVTVTVANAAPPPADTTPPTVTITSPTSGATVSGTITVTASASDNVGVAGVQFFVDGAPLGAEDTTAPYATSWDTTTVADGTHTLAARARDAAGNTATSALVTVTVANGAPGPTPTRFEETAATLAPAGAWSEITSAGIGVTVSGDRAVFASAAGATATFSFTGTGVSWLGVRCEVCGIANVRLDGTLVGTVDTFASTRSAAVLFSASGLAAGSHTLAIEVTGTRSASSGGDFIIVDAFDVTSDGTAPPPSDTTPPTVAITSPSGGATVSGTITVTATASDNVGVAGVQFLLDGAPLGAEDTTAPYAISWDTTTVPNGTHTLAARARDAAGNTATSPPVTVTVANGAPGPTPTRFEESAATLTPAEDWFGVTSTSARGAALSGDFAVAASAAGARATFSFTGTGVSWIGLPCPECGIANVYVDGVQVATVDTFSPTWPAASGPVFTMSGLAAGSHTLVIEATFTWNPSSTQGFVIVDAFDVSS